VAKNIGRALDDAERKGIRPMPKTTQGQFNYLVRLAKGDTRILGEMLGVGPRQALRYKKGEAKLPEERIRKATEQRWAPRARARARRQIAQNGIIVELRARFGFTAAPGTTDDTRMRFLTQPLPPDYGARLLDAPNEAARRQVLAEGLAFFYFRDRGQRAHELDVFVTDVEDVVIEPFT
jgi:hypothetical protein